MAKSILCSVFMRNPKTCLVSTFLAGGSLRYCKQYVAQAIAKGQDPNCLVIVPLQLLDPVSPADADLIEEVDHGQ